MHTPCQSYEGQLGYYDGLATIYVRISDPARLPYAFTDVDAGAWYATGGYLQYVVGANLMSGMKNGDGSSQRLFKPEEPLTRGQVVTILYRYLYPSATDTTDSSSYAASSGFLGGENTYYYCNAAIKWAADNGIVTGYTTGPNAGEFMPDKAVTREELATIVHRFARNVPGVDVSNPDRTAYDGTVDHDKVRPFAVDAMVWCAAAGLITGNDQADGSLTLEPQANATRGQATKIFTVLTHDVAGGGVSIATLSSGPAWAELGRTMVEAPKVVEAPKDEAVEIAENSGTEENNQAGKNADDETAEAPEEPASDEIPMVDEAPDNSTTDEGGKQAPELPSNDATEPADENPEVDETQPVEAGEDEPARPTEPASPDETDMGSVDNEGPTEQESGTIPADTPVADELAA